MRQNMTVENARGNLKSPEVIRRLMELKRVTGIKSTTELIRFSITYTHRQLTMPNHTLDNPTANNKEAN